MKKILEQGDFSSYRKSSLTESMSTIIPQTYYDTKKPTVFISHKHDELDDLKGLIGYLEQTYDVKAYIDSQDPSMPRITSEETATNLKERIKKCDKFILIATNGAIQSKWCNWELGYGDSQKFDKHIALLPMKPKNASDREYKGAEYLQIYPFISYFYGIEKYRTGKLIPKGYYVCTPNNDMLDIIPLKDWLES